MVAQPQTFAHVNHTSKCVIDSKSLGGAPREKSVLVTLRHAHMLMTQYTIVSFGTKQSEVQVSHPHEDDYPRHLAGIDGALSWRFLRLEVLSEFFKEFAQFWRDVRQFVGKVITA
jgi:hypothetical protein